MRGPSIQDDTRQEQAADRTDNIEKAENQGVDTGTSPDTGKNSLLSRRGALAVLAGMGLIGTASKPVAAATSLEFGNNYSGTPGSGYGLKLSANSKGIVGEADDSETFTIGVEGRSPAEKGRGIAGYADHPSGEAYGVLGRTASTGGNGVYGFSTATSGDTRGVLGISKSPSGTAVLGYNPAGSSTAYAGRFESDSPGAVALLGKANAGSGTTYGVKGVAASPSGYGLYTPDRAKIDQDLEVGGRVTASNINIQGGTINHTDVLQVYLDGTLNFYITPQTSNGEAGNTLAGAVPNIINTTASHGATISGGGQDTDPNVVHDNFGTIGGGLDNTVGTSDGDATTAPYATVGGGESNKATARHSTVSGGFNNDVTADRGTISGGDSNTVTGARGHVGGGFANEAASFDAVVPGGQLCSAIGSRSFAAGYTAQAADDESFVWNDGGAYHDTTGNGSDDGLSSAQDIAGSGVTGANTFHVGATGGIRLITGSNSVTYISGGSTGWATTSTRTAKTNFNPVDTKAVVDGVAEMDISTWEYTDEDGQGQGERHIGPMAEDFHDVVDVGTNDSHINSINADGVLFAAVQGLNEKLEDRNDCVAELEGENERLREHNRELKAETDDLRKRNADFEARLGAVEDYLGLNGHSDRSVTTND